MKKSLLLLATVLFIVPFAQAQNQSEPCGFDIWMRHVHQNFPERAARIADDYFNLLQEFQTGQRDGVLQIPVVFHVVYNNAAQNLPDSVLQSQIEVLNEDYRRLNLNANETRDIFLPVAADAEIEFYLADIDPEGNPSNGIVRTETERSGFALDLFSQVNTLDEVKSSTTGGSDAWDTEHYLNVWVCNIEESILGQVFGLAYPPDGTPNWPDGSAEPSEAVSGVIVHYTTVGRNNPSANLDGVSGNNLGRTLTHETGHYFGLRHIWGDGFFNGCSADDGLMDTPNCSAASSQTCNFNANTCADSPINFPDMVENYMDYSNESCLNMFTQEQVDMMRFVITELRPGLIASVASVADSELEHAFSVFPNPTNSFLNISSAKNKIDAIEVLDIVGRVQNGVQYKGTTSSEIQISLDYLSQGPYFLRIYSEGQMVVKKIIIQ
jgi:hypothetical protein